MQQSNAQIVEFPRSYSAHPAPFIILALPRSRTAWLSKFLSYDGAKCGHDIAADCGSVAEFKAKLSGLVGSVETGAVIGWKAIREAIPDAKIIVLKRPLDQIQDSLRAIGLGDASILSEVAERRLILDVVGEQEDVPTISYDALNERDGCAWLFEYCLHKSFDMAWWDSFKDKNIQVDVAQMMQKLARNREKIKALKAEISQPKAVITCEPWGKFEPDCLSLGAEHFAETDTGVEPRRPFKLDLPMMREISDTGFFRVYSARKNGKLIGYIMWTIQNDPESEGLLIANMGPWFVSHEAGRFRVGERLFDESIADLKSLGVKNVFPHHRMQGRGAKLGDFFKRKGAKEVQHTYSLWIGN